MWIYLQELENGRYLPRRRVLVQQEDEYRQQINGNLQQRRVSPDGELHDS
jgi:hypothetical protein